jgi:uncharacterized membrane protein
MITICKTLTYSIMHVTVAVTIGYAITGSFEKALAIGLIEPFVQTFFFFIHENIWNKKLAIRHG